MELKFLNYTYNDTYIDMDIKNNNITGITGTYNKDIINVLSLINIGKGQIIVDGAKVTKDNIYDYRKKISLVPLFLPEYTFISTVQELMNYNIKQHNLIMKNEDKKIRDSLRIVGLDETCLTKTMKEISTSEKKLLQISISLLSNPEMIIVNEPFKNLDTKNEKKLMMLFQRLKEQFHKTIVFLSDDSNILYKYTDEMIFIKNNKIILTGPTEEVYLRVDYLSRNKFSIPDIVKFTYLAKKKKQVKIDYHKDIRDIIKDIYKHV